VDLGSSSTSSPNPGLERALIRHRTDEGRQAVSTITSPRSVAGLASVARTRDIIWARERGLRAKVKLLIKWEKPNSPRLD
jgi:hypothetical protein